MATRSSKDDLNQYITAFESYPTNLYHASVYSYAGSPYACASPLKKHAIDTAPASGVPIVFSP